MTERQDRRRAQRVKLEWTARLETGAGVVEGPVVDLSLIGVRIGTAADLPVGASGTLRLAFFTPDSRQEVVSLAATVARSGEDCVAATFDGLPEAAARWLRVRLLSADTRRRSPRVRVTLPVELTGGSMTPVEGETVDLSAFGAEGMGVSRLHIRIRRKGILLYVADLDSTNGTHLNGRKLIPDGDRVLRDGDELYLGRLCIRVRF